MIQKPEPVKRTETAEMERNGAGAAARQRQADLGSARFVHTERAVQAAAEILTELIRVVVSSVGPGCVSSDTPPSMLVENTCLATRL